MLLCYRLPLVAPSGVGSSRTMDPSSSAMAISARGTCFGTMPPRYCWEGAEAPGVINTVAEGAVVGSDGSGAAALHRGHIDTVRKVFTQIEPYVIIVNSVAISVDIKVWL